MHSTDFKQIDVFTSESFKGNPVAVILNAEGLSTEKMQRISNWTNLSETTFVLPPKNPQADYYVRIFTPAKELPFAGHPTIGTAHALLEGNLISAKQGKIVQECAAGLINLNVKDTINGPLISFELPEPLVTVLDQQNINELEAILNCPVDKGLTPALIDIGIRWIVVHTSDAETVLVNQPDFSKLYDFSNKMNVAGVCTFGEYPDSSIEVRSFAPICGANEDPVCGSGNGSVAAFMRFHNVVDTASKTEIKSSQGKILGRQGSINLTISADKILVGGTAVTCIEGVLKY